MVSLISLHPSFGRNPQAGCPEEHHFDVPTSPGWANDHNNITVFQI
jgi:hypothetical protein